MAITGNPTQNSLSFASATELANTDVQWCADGEWAYTQDTGTTYRLRRAIMNGAGGVPVKGGYGTWVPCSASDYVEVLTVTDLSETLTLAPYGVSVLENSAGGYFFFNLPDATDGTVKEIVSGANGQNAANAFSVRCTNNLGNDLLDFDVGWAVRLVWVTARGGWVAINYTPNANAAWD